MDKISELDNIDKEGFLWRNVGKWGMESYSWIIFDMKGFLVASRRGKTQ